ncbi:MAG: hypothetical protein GY874_10115 [Desulfobacteraceae bacterium]|nr:hypothetical protein [Desulfobacteraceae bacterium]
MDARQANLESKQWQLNFFSSEQAQQKRTLKQLEQIREFNEQAKMLGLARKDWNFYVVNVQGEFNYDTALQIIGQCKDSERAYYWPISMEISNLKKDGKSQASSSNSSKKLAGDVRLSVTGKFLARQK